VKGEKSVDVFCSRDKRLQLSPSGDRGAWQTLPGERAASRLFLDDKLAR